MRKQNTLTKVGERTDEQLVRQSVGLAIGGSGGCEATLDERN